KSQAEGALLLDFRLLGPRESTLVTCSDFPLEDPRVIAAAFSEEAFRTAAAKEIWVDLIYALEKDFSDWEERRPKADRNPGDSGRSISDSRIVIVTRIKTVSQFNRALQLFLQTASAL